MIMRSKTTAKELPTRAAVRTCISNEFMRFFERLRVDVGKAPGSVSVLWDMWTMPQTSYGFFGMLAQWIEVKGSTWTFCVEVIAMHKVVGRHDALNLSKYILKFLDRAQITTKNESKVHASIDYEYTCN